LALKSVDYKKALAFKLTIELTHKNNGSTWISHCHVTEVSYFINLLYRQLIMSLLFFILFSIMLIL